MKISNIRVEETDEYVELSGMLDDYRLWYRFPPGTPCSRRGDAFLAAGLLPAMASGDTLRIPAGAPVSPQLMRSCEVIQDIFRCWYPELKKIAVECELERPESVGHEIGSFFSGGVDGTYTFLKHDEEITQLLFIRGIDMQLTNDETYDEAFQNNRDFAAAYGMQLLPIVSNVRFLFHHFSTRGWNLVGNGAGLASVAHALNLKRTYIASSHAYTELTPLGSHPLIDGLFSTEVNEIIHDGAEATRGDKLVSIAKSPIAMKILRVCWQDQGYNCNECEKCMRTRIALRALGLNSPALKPLESLDEVRRFRVYGDGKLTFLRENLQLALRSGDQQLARALETCVWRHESRRVLKEVDRVLLNGSVSKIARRIRGGSTGIPATGRPA